ncbi:hypothetical protein [Haloglomus salinum]|uniref:hypothetical protein n=1 Tax=Haloglomus salinum TaxID=2962673 RepID=UPI0020C99777|nr:hypothetical protein [Haloglomus salinum]
MTNDDGDRGIARRKVLAAAAGAGGLGVVGGVGSAALLRDEESFSGLFESGSLELDVAWNNTDGENLTAKLETGNTSGQELLDISLPGSENNPAHVWFQPTCPPESAAGLADALELSVRYADAQGTPGDHVLDADGVAIDGRTLRDLAEQPGTKLQFGDDGCLDADTTRYLLVGWEYTEDSAEFDETDFDLEFFAEQCRNNDAPTNPYEPLSCPVSSGKDISWVAFCAADGETLTDGDLVFTVSGDTLDLTSAPSTLETVVLKYGPEIRVFTDPGTSGTFTTATGGTTYDKSGNSFPGSGRTNSEPCPGMCGLKYERTFQTPESKGCEE